MQAAVAWRWDISGDKSRLRCCWRPHGSILGGSRPWEGAACRTAVCLALWRHREQALSPARQGGSQTVQARVCNSCVLSACLNDSCSMQGMGLLLRRGPVCLILE